MTQAPLESQFVDVRAGGHTAGPSAAASPALPPQQSVVASLGRQVVAPRHGRRDSAVRRLLALGDVAGLAVALSLALALQGSSHAGSKTIWALLTLPAWIVIFKAYGLYDRDIKRISHATVDELPWIFHGMLMGCLLLWLYYHLAPPGKLHFESLLAFAALATALVVALRSLARRIALSVLGPERVLLIGEGEEVAVLADKMRAHPEYGVEPVGFISRSGMRSAGSSLPVLGRAVGVSLAEVIAQNGVERVVVSHVDIDEAALLDLIRQCRELQVKVSVLPQLVDAMGPSLEVDDVEGITVLGINPPVLSPSSRLLKRAMDLAGGAFMLLLTAPALVVIALAVKLDSRGPVLFRQERIGKGGRRFRLIKFRTMVDRAEQMAPELSAESRDPGWLLLEHDPRVTRVGRVLRLFSLDELPQLLNVLKGEMSLVGPRPIIESEDQQLHGWRRSRVDLTPGLTGLWQVLGRTKISFEEMIKLDYLYVTNWSLWGDIRLMLRTLPAVITRRGAN